MKQSKDSIESTNEDLITDDPKTSALKEEAWNTSKILLEAQECLKVLEYLIKDDPEVDVYNKHFDLFWRFTMSVYSEHVLLKLNILFNPTEHFSIDALLQKLKTNGMFNGIVSDAKINEWETTIAAMNATYEKIRQRRNKLIAHKDRNPGKKAKADISIAELKNIVVMVQNIVKEIYWIVAGASFQIDEPLTGSPVDSLRHIMKTLDTQRREELRPLFEQARANGLVDQLPPSER